MNTVIHELKCLITRSLLLFVSIRLSYCTTLLKIFSIIGLVTSRVGGDGTGGLNHGLVSLP